MRVTFGGGTVEGYMTMQLCDGKNNRVVTYFLLSHHELKLWRKMSCH